jgi:hypothetical protein
VKREKRGFWKTWGKAYLVKEKHGVRFSFAAALPGKTSKRAYLWRKERGVGSFLHAGLARTVGRAWSG